MQILDFIKRRKIFLAVIFIIIITIIIIMKGCKQNVNVVYDYDVIKRGLVKKTISVSGSLDLEEVFTVKSEIAGEITAIYTDINAKVKKNQLLAEIHSESIEEQISSFYETYKREKLDLNSMRELFITKKNLFKENLISESELKNVQRNYTKSLSSFKLTSRHYNKLLEKRKGKKVYAPVAGTVYVNYIKLRQVIGAESPLFLIAPSFKKMVLNINIDETDIGLVKKGQLVDFTVSAYPEKNFSGKLTTIQLNPETRKGIITYGAEAVCDNKNELLRPGMTVTATVNIDKRNNVMLVPNQALRATPVVKPLKVKLQKNEKIIWKKTSSLWKKLPMRPIKVKLGLVGDFNTEVISNELKPGDKILIGSHKKLEVKDELAGYGN